MMYAPARHGKRSSFYSASPRLLARGGRQAELAPVGKLFRFTRGAALARQWVRDHTTNRFGPVAKSRRAGAGDPFDGIARFDPPQVGARHALRASSHKTDKTGRPEADTSTTCCGSCHDQPMVETSPGALPPQDPYPAGQAAHRTFRPRPATERAGGGSIMAPEAALRPPRSHQILIEQGESRPAPTCCPCATRA